ncbi:MAG: Gfo/Idh/MocA family oxidoreductase [Saprospiraceae bacterium]|nr:Gfo/Idh/MocA family oxidoreductase [Saprospiraceae bacterium]
MQRRSFIKTSSIATASWMTPGWSFRPQEGRIKIGIVGTGWWGTDYLLKYALESEAFDIVALCDVSKVALQTALDKLAEAGVPAPNTYKTYEALYDHPGLQAVIIATPTHWHALQFIAACQKGLHVWQEKPISYDIREAQAMSRAYQQAGVAVNIDFPRLQAPINDQVKDFIRSGQLGEVHQIEFNIHNPVGIPKEVEIPKSIDFDAYCGPAPLQKYLEHPRPGRLNWRVQQGFSRGILADWGIHYLQNIRSVMDLDLPIGVEAIGGITRKIKGVQHPDHLQVHFDYDGLPVIWNHKTWGFTSTLPHTKIGTFYYGDKGTIFAADSGWEFYPADGSSRKAFGNPRVKLGSKEFEAEIRREFVAQFLSFAEAIKHKEENAIKGTFEEGFNSTSAVIYADLAYLTKCKLDIEPTTMNVKNNDVAQEMLKRSYRAPYVHPYST